MVSMKLLIDANICALVKAKTHGSMATDLRGGENFNKFLFSNSWMYVYGSEKL